MHDLRSRRRVIMSVVGLLCAVAGLLVPNSTVHAQSAAGVSGRANAEAYKVQGDQFREARDYARAIAAYKQALALDPSHRTALYLLAVTYSVAQNWQESVATWDKWLATGAHESPDAKASALNLLGNAHRQLKHRDKAVETLQSAIALAPKPEILSSSHHFLGRTYDDMRQHEKAVAAYQEAVRVNPGDGSSYREMGLSLFHLGRNDQAVTSLQQAIRLRANDGLAYYDLGYIYLQTGRKAEALQIQQTLQTIDPSRAQQFATEIAKWTPAYAAYQAGWKQFNDHEYAKAISSLLEAARLDPNSLDAHTVLGEAYDRTMQFEKAAAAYKRAIEIKPGDHHALRYLGTAYMMMGKKTEALEVHNRLTNIDKTGGELLLADINRPGGPAAILAGNAQSELIGGDEQTALDHLQNALRLRPTDPDALFEIGFAYELWDHVDEADAAYRSVLGLRAAPDKIAEAHRRLGSMYNDRKEYAKALPELKEAQRIKPDSYTSQLLGDCYTGLRDLTSALAAYQNAVLLKPDSADAQFGIGLAYLAMKQYDKALGPFQEVARLEPKAARGFYELGHTYFLMRRPLDAVSVLTKATSLEPRHAHAHFGLGMAYRVVGRRDDALREYETLKSLDAKLAEQLLHALNGPSSAGGPSRRPRVETSSP
jgi:tetratricopeptide (TPR) repeat protein